MYITNAIPLLLSGDIQAGHLSTLHPKPYPLEIPKIRSSWASLMSSEGDRPYSSRAACQGSFTALILPCKACFLGGSFKVCFKSSFNACFKAFF